MLVITFKALYDIEPVYLGGFLFLVISARSSRSGRAGILLSGEELSPGGFQEMGPILWNSLLSIPPPDLDNSDPISFSED